MMDNSTSAICCVVAVDDSISGSVDGNSNNQLGHSNAVCSDRSQSAVDSDSTSTINGDANYSKNITGNICDSAGAGAITCTIINTVASAGTITSTAPSIANSVTAPSIANSVTAVAINSNNNSTSTIDITVADTITGNSTIEATRKSHRKRNNFTIPHRLKMLFHDSQPTYNANKLILIHTNPNIYVCKDFLTEGEIDYFNQICTSYSNKFSKSYTENCAHNRVISTERTSKFIFLSKSQDKFVRSIEQRASDTVGLSATSVEPIQIVSYKDGQRFNLHHDAGTLSEVNANSDSDSDSDNNSGNNSGNNNNNSNSNCINHNKSNNVHSNINSNSYSKSNSNSYINSSSNNNNKNSDDDHNSDNGTKNRCNSGSNIESNSAQDCDAIDIEDRPSSNTDEIEKDNAQNSEQYFVDEEDLSITKVSCNGRKESDRDAKRIKSEYTVAAVDPLRLVTFFVYLNDLPVGEGQTDFPLINLSVQPRRNYALLFCNVLPNGLPDVRVAHKANSVSNNLLKYGLNIWLCNSNLQQLVHAAPTVTIRKSTNKKRKYTDNNDDSMISTTVKSIKTNNIKKKNNCAEGSLNYEQTAFGIAKKKLESYLDKLKHTAKDTPVGSETMKISDNSLTISGQDDENYDSQCMQYWVNDDVTVAADTK